MPHLGRYIRRIHYIIVTSRICLNLYDMNESTEIHVICISIGNLYAQLSNSRLLRIQRKSVFLTEVSHGRYTFRDIKTYNIHFQA